jgi:hypothetical protein
MSRKSVVLSTVILLIAAITICTVSSCGKGIRLSGGGGGSRAQVVSLTPSYFNNVGTEVEISGQTYNADAYIWYDYMPTTGPGTKNPTVTGHIILISGSNFDVEFSPNKVWVISDTPVWEWPVERLSDVGYDLGPVLAFHGEAGPDLGVGSVYDVVIDFTDENSVHYKVKVENVQVDAAY